jgi:LPS-assembly lipoprotein
MSSPRGNKPQDGPSRRALLRGLAVTLAAAPILAACGPGDFQPLYGPTASGEHLQDVLAKVDIAPIPSRVGQRVRNELIFHNTGGGAAPKPDYRLEIVLREGINSTLVTTTGEAYSQVYNVEAAYQLINIKKKEVVLKGSSHARAAFERYQSIYANVRARDDAEVRVARTIADELKVRLSAYLSRAPA